MRLAGKKVLVTGGAGFIPSHVVDLFVLAGSSVTVLDNFSSGNKNNLVDTKKDIQIINMDIRDNKVKGIVKNHDIVVHMAANADVPLSVKNPDFDFQNNVLGSYNILTACLNSNVQKIIFASSAAVYGEPRYAPIDEKHPTNPRSPYGASKLAIEKLGIAYYETYRLPFTVIRIFNTYGIRQPRYVMFDLLRKLNKESTKLEVLGTGEQVRDYSYVTDTARSFLLATESDKAVGEIYNIAGGNSISIKELAHKLISTLGLKGVKVTFTGKSWPGDINVLSANISKAKDDLNFLPKVPLEEGIGYLSNWLRDQKA